MHSFTSGSSIVTLTRHPSGGSGNTNPPGTTLAFTDADGNVITLPDGVVTSTGSDGGVTIVTTDSLVGSHFLSATDGVGPVTKIEIDDDHDHDIHQMDLMASSPGASTSKGIKKGKNVKVWNQQQFFQTFLISRLIFRKIFYHFFKY